MSTEKWARIPRYADSYDVSDHGRVRNADTGRVLAVKLRNGYATVGLYSAPGQQRTERVHRLVLEAFVGPRPEGMECRHLDGDRLNNTPANLCWGTHKENTADTIAHGRLYRRPRVLNAEDVRAVFEAVTREPTRAVAARLGTDQATVRGVVWRHRYEDVPVDDALVAAAQAALSSRRVSP